MRIYTSESDPLDFCIHCQPSEAAAEELYGDLGDGPDGRGNCYAYDAEHPDYEDGGIYCENCGIELDWQD